MMGLFSQAGSTFGRDKPPSDTEPDDTSILSVSNFLLIYPSKCISQRRRRGLHHHLPHLPAQASHLEKNCLSPLIPPRVGMDLSKVTFPTFVLEPRSMLERITDFMSHPDLIFGHVLIHPASSRANCSAARRALTTRRSASSASCSTTSRAGTSSPRASRSRESPPLIPLLPANIPQVQPRPRRVLQVQVRLRERHAGLLHCRARSAPSPPAQHSR